MTRKLTSLAYTSVVLLGAFVLLSNCDSLSGLDDEKEPSTFSQATTSLSTYKSTSSLAEGTEIQITMGLADQWAPDVSSDYIVWHDEESGTLKVVLYEIATGIKTELTDGTTRGSFPAISGDYVVWTAVRNDSVGFDVYIDLYKISTGSHERITTDVASPNFPDISGDYIVWQDARNDFWDIYLYEISSGTETRITDEAADQYNPAISGDYVVWQDARKGNLDIYMYQISTGRETQLTDETADQFSPAISGDYIVWEGLENYDLFLYQISTGVETQLWPDTYETAYYGSPAISGDFVVWENFSYGQVDLFLYQISTDRAREISTQWGNQWAPAISGSNIVWTDDRNGDRDIYYYKIPGLAVPPGPVEQIESLREVLGGLNIDRGIANSLNAKLEGALKSLQAGNTHAAAGKLNAFINQTKAQRGKKIATDNADALIAEAAAILSLMG